VIEVAVVRSVDSSLVGAMNALVPQLSTSAPPLTRADLEAIVASPVTTLFVARTGADVVGILTLAVFRIPTGVRAWIEDVVVDERARGAGAGEALTRAALDEARRRGARSVDLTSRSSRVAANALYRRLGFAPRETNVYRFFLESREPE
jgi:ribosomal protein S18 acetylase RimI-like enzyme